MVDAVNDVKEAAFFLKKEKPYWWDMKTQIREIKQMVIDLKVAIRDQGTSWVTDTAKAVKDEIDLFTEGGVTMASCLSFDLVLVLLVLVVVILLRLFCV